MRVLAGAAIALSLAAPASAQVTPSGSGATLPSTGGIADPGGLSVGGGTGGAASNPGGLSFGRTRGTGGAPSGTGAGIATGSNGVQPPDDTYLYPLYGRSFR